MKKRVLVVLGGGGHTAQARRLVSGLGARHDYVFVGSDKVVDPREKNDYNPFWIAIKTLISSVQALFFLLKSRVDSIIAFGPAIAVPFCVIGKLLGKKIIYIESWARVNTVSKSGRIVYPFADVFLVQWKPLLKLLPRAQYAGRIA